MVTYPTADTPLEDVEKAADEALYGTPRVEIHELQDESSARRFARLILKTERFVAEISECEDRDNVEWVISLIKKHELLDNYSLRRILLKK